MLAKRHPSFIVHRIYSDSHHNVIQHRPDWFVRDATELLRLVQQRPRG
jgi:hypothetical protein